MAKPHRTARKQGSHRKPAASKPPRLTVIEAETAPDPQNANVQQSEIEDRENTEETEQKDNRQDAERAELEQDENLPPNYER